MSDTPITDQLKEILLLVGQMLHAGTQHDLDTLQRWLVAYAEASEARTRAQEDTRALTYLVHGGWYHRTPHALPLFWCWPDLTQALAAFLAVQQQGYDWCGLTRVPLAIGGGEDRRQGAS
jgi:hypothetical protein